MVLQSVHMKTFFALAFSAVLLFAAGAAAQTAVVVHDPTKVSPAAKLTPAEQAVFNKALPAVRKKISEEACSESVDVSGVVQGSFTAAGAKQTLVFYQYCQTGNGFGFAGLVLIENGRVIGNFFADTGWTMEIVRVADLNGNGLDEFTLAYSGGMHQGHGGVGVDLMEFADGTPKGIGWYKSEEFDDTQASSAWKLTAKPGPVPVFYRQKFTSRDGNKWRAVGAATVFKLGKAISNFEAVK